MPKNIVICSDGTGNTANKDRGTNVFKIFEAIDLRSEKFPAPRDPGKTVDRQVTIYDDGVGSQDFIVFKILGGAFGWGLKRNVKKLYTELARAYEPGDNLYLFGFSRGGFTIRTLIGFIASCGIPKKSYFSNQDELERLVDDAYKCHQQKYRSRLNQLCFPGWFYEWLPKGFLKWLPRFISLRLPFGVVYDPESYHQKPPIRFIGAWDTVSAVGLPFKGATNFWNEWVYRCSFRVNNLYEKVEKACQALSIDDERQTFHPELWNEDPAAYPNKTEEDWNSEWIEQVWFPGVHSNVGGGYPKQGMSLVTLHWMMVRAHEAGLLFIDQDWDAVREHGNISDKLYDSRAGIAFFYRYLPRNILAMSSQKKNEHYKVCIDTIKVHECLKERIDLGTEGYAPGNLPPEFLLVRDIPGDHDQYSYSRKVFNGADPKKETRLWKELQPFVDLIRQAYYLFLVTTLLGVFFYVRDLFRVAGSHLAASKVTRPDCWQTLGQAWEDFKLFDLLWSFVSNPYLLAGLGTALAATALIRFKMAKLRTNFWMPYRRISTTRNIGKKIPAATP